jgi:outer membrane protein
MKFSKKIIFTSCFVIFSLLQINLNANIPYFIDFKYILNESDAGKKAQTFLKNKLSNGIKQLKSKEKSIQEEEKKIIQQKKLIDADEYKKKVNVLRGKVSALQKERNDLLNGVAKQRAEAKLELLKNLNPIIKEYMEKNKIRMVLDKKSLLLADENLDITDKILKSLNNKLKSIKLN